MQLTQYAVFELCTECNLGDIHAKCPNSHPDRYAELPHDKPVSDERIIEMVTALYREHGFRGHIGWHYYNEPLMAAERMWRLMDAITLAVPEATYTLWTNGILLPEDCSEFNRFAEVHVTNYGRWGTIVNLKALQASMPAVHYQRGSLDDRLHAIGDKVVSTTPCNRMFTEFIVDYYGNVHLCCYDWQGLGSPGNVHEETLSDLLENWKWVRTLLMSPIAMTVGPPSCLHCKVRSAYIPNFIPTIAKAARRFVEETCQK